MTRRPLVAAVLASLAVTSALVFVSWRPARAEPVASGGVPGAQESASAGRTDPTAIPIPIPGHEVYGFVPYWEMDDGIAAHVAATDLTTLGLFSVTHKKDGTLATGERGYRRIIGSAGRALTAAAHERGTRVELVYTSFGAGKNAAFFTNREAQDRTIEELVGLVADLGLDGVNVDVESLGLEHVSAYGDFVGRLRTAVRARDGDAEVSVATTAGVRGVAMALAATDAGTDRIFMMGYDYHYAGSQPGASAPLDRRDGSQKTLGWSLDLYRDGGVPADRTILGLPLYGVSWPVIGPEIGAPSSGRGDVWIPRHNLDSLADSVNQPLRDTFEGVEVLVRPDGEAWTATYFDSAATLAPKLSLADDRGLAGAGFWAIGYERGVAAYTELIAAFHAGELDATLGGASP